MPTNFPPVPVPRYVAKIRRNPSKDFSRWVDGAALLSSPNLYLPSCHLQPLMERAYALRIGCIVHCFPCLRKLVNLIERNRTFFRIRLLSPNQTSRFWPLNETFFGRPLSLAGLTLESFVIVDPGQGHQLVYEIGILPLAEPFTGHASGFSFVT